MITNALKKLLQSRGLSSVGIKDIADAIERLTDDSYIRETLAKLITNLADGYSDDRTYPIGDYVFYDDVLYKCVEPVTVTEPFDSNKWVRTTVEEMFINADVSAAVATLANDIGPMYDPTNAYAVGDYAVYQFALYRKTSGNTVAENWDSTHWTPVNLSSLIKSLQDAIGGNILDVKITYNASTERATSNVTGADINTAIAAGKTILAYINEIPAKVTKTGIGNSYTISFDAQYVSSYGTDNVVLEDILVRYVNITGQWATTVTTKTIPLNGGSSSDGGSLVITLTHHEDEYEDVTSYENYKGVYDSTTEYSYNDIVLESEDTTSYYFIYVNDEPSIGEDLYDNTYWNIIDTPISVYEYYSSDCSWDDINDAYESGKIVYATLGAADKKFYLTTISAQIVELEDVSYATNFYNFENHGDYLALNVINSTESHSTDLCKFYLTTKSIPYASDDEDTDTDNSLLIIPVIKSEETDEESSYYIYYELDENCSIDDVIDAINANKLLALSIKDKDNRNQLEYYMLTDVTPKNDSAYIYSFYNALNDKKTELTVDMSTYNYIIDVYTNE